MVWTSTAVTAAQMNAHAPQERTAYVPTIAGGGTIGNATRAGTYIQHGKTVHFWARIILGTTSAVTGSLSISLPVTAIAPSTLGVDVLNAIFNDISGNFYFASGFANGASASVYVVGVNGAAASTSATVPFTWATGDIIYVSGTYEAA